MNEQHFVINIGRQLSSGGKEIASRLAKHYGITVYDRKLIELAAKESGLNEEFFEKADEKKSYNFIQCFFSGRMANALSDGMNYLSEDSLFLIQSKTIQALAEKESCIFVGRCADYILRKHPRCVNIFFTANMEDRIARLCKSGEIRTEDAEELLEKADHRRSSYYNYYSGNTWGAASTYDLCINTSILGIEETTQQVIRFIDATLGLK